MKQIKDLNIEDEILPIFNYTLNLHSKKKVLEILNNTLSSKKEIIYRQSILKGFLKNSEILSNYFYYKSYFSEVYNLFENYEFENLVKVKWRYKLLISKSIKLEHRSKLTQLVLLFNKLNKDYFSKIETNVFPKLYKNKIKEIYFFLLEFNLEKYGELIIQSKLRDKHILELFNKILELKQDERIESFWENFIEFEAFYAISNGIKCNNFNFPAISENKIVLEKFYHPVLKNPVLNSFETSSNVIILNGANMSGKSTFLKSISLCFYLANIGIAIPAEKSEIPFISNFSIKITKNDDLTKGYSHFMSEIINLKEVVEKAINGEKCFAVFDELFSSTNVEDAFEICKTTIKGLSRFNNSFFFISTHNQGLEGIKKSNIDSYYLDTELKDENPNFNYKIKKGWSNIKVGQILFEKEGLNKMLEN